MCFLSSAAYQTVDCESGNFIQPVYSVLAICSTGWIYVLHSCDTLTQCLSEKGLGSTLGVGKLETEPSSGANCFLPTYWQCRSLFLRLRSFVSNHYYSFQFVCMWECKMQIWNIWNIKCRYGISPSRLSLCWLLDRRYFRFII